MHELGYCVPQRYYQETGNDQSERHVPNKLGAGSDHEHNRDKHMPRVKFEWATTASTAR